MIGTPCCNPAMMTIIGVIPDPDPVDPPVLSEYCVQWGTVPTNPFFPCVEGFEVNGETGQGVLCGGYFTIVDFEEVGNKFLYANFGADAFYSQVILPVDNAMLDDLGYYIFDIFGTPSDPQPIPATNSNCYLNCYTATFDVVDVDTDGFTSFRYNDAVQQIDLFPVTQTPFSSPTHDAEVLTQMLNFLEPSATFESSYVGNTVTVTITTIMTIIYAIWSNTGGSQTGEIPLTPCT